MKLVRFLAIKGPLFAILAISLAGFIAVSLLLVEQLHSWLFVALFVPSMVLLTRFFTQSIGEDDLLKKGAPYRMSVDAIFFALLLVWSVGNAYFTTQHILVDRDPAIYANAAAWIVDNPTLDFDNDKLFVSEDIFISTSGFQPHPETREIVAQGQHFLPALMGLTGRIVGAQAMYTWVIGFGALALAGMYALGRKLLGQGWSLMATGALAVSLPFIHFARDSYTEPLSLALAMGAILMTMIAIHRNKRGVWLLSGFLIAATALNRIDAYMAMVGFVALIYLQVLTIKKTKQALTPLYAILAMPPVLVIAWLDLYILSRQYYENLDSRYLSQLAALAASVIGGLGLVYVVRKWTALGAIYTKLRTVLASASSISFVLLFAFFISMPLWRVTLSAQFKTFIEALQRREGLPINGYQNYNELSTEWISNYIGQPLWLLGLAGAAWVLYRFFKQNDQTYLPVLVIFLAGSLVYFWKPFITPDQLWATRRFLPITYPLLLILAFHVISYIASHVRIKQLSTKITALVVLIVLLGVYPVQATVRYAGVRAYEQYDFVQEVCDITNTEPTIITWMERSRQLLQQSAYVHCNDTLSYGFGRVGEGRKPTQERLSHLATSSTDAGYRPLIAVFEADLALLEQETTGLKNMKVLSYRYESIEETLTKRPRAVFVHENRLYIGRLALDGTIVAP